MLICIGGISLTLTKVYRRFVTPISLNIWQRKLEYLCKIDKAVKSFPRHLSRRLVSHSLAFSEIEILAKGRPTKYLRLVPMPDERCQGNSCMATHRRKTQKRASKEATQRQSNATRPWRTLDPWENQAKMQQIAQYGEPDPRWSKANEPQCTKAAEAKRAWSNRLGMSALHQ